MPPLPVISGTEAVGAKRKSFWRRQFAKTCPHLARVCGLKVTYLFGAPSTWA